MAATWVVNGHCENPTFLMRNYAFLTRKCAFLSRILLSIWCKCIFDKIDAFWYNWMQHFWIYAYLSNINSKFECRFVSAFQRHQTRLLIRNIVFPHFLSAEWLEGICRDTPHHIPRGIIGSDHISLFGTIMIGIGMRLKCDDSNISWHYLCISVLSGPIQNLILIHLAPSSPVKDMFRVMCGMDVCLDKSEPRWMVTGGSQGLCIICSFIQKYSCK